MKPDLPFFAETRPGELPDAYFVDGARLTPLSRITDEILTIATLPRTAARVADAIADSGAVAELRTSRRAFGFRG